MQTPSDAMASRRRSGLAILRRRGLDRRALPILRLRDRFQILRSTCISQDTMTDPRCRRFLNARIASFGDGPDSLWQDRYPKVPSPQRVAALFQLRRIGQPEKDCSPDR